MIEPLTRSTRKGMSHMRKPLQAHAQRNYSMNGFDLFLIAPGDAGNVNVATELVFTEVEQGMVWPPSLAISRQAMQSLFDDLWNAGMRPSREDVSVGALQAAQAHIDSLKRINDALLRMLEAKRQE
jgi:hypothetical protein